MAGWRRARIWRNGVKLKNCSDWTDQSNCFIFVEYIIARNFLPARAGALCGAFDSIWLACDTSGANGGRAGEIELRAALSHLFSHNC